MSLIIASVLYCLSFVAVAYTVVLYDKTRKAREEASKIEKENERKGKLVSQLAEERDSIMESYSHLVEICRLQSPSHRVVTDASFLLAIKVAKAGDNAKTEATRKALRAIYKILTEHLSEYPPLDRASVLKLKEPVDEYLHACFKYHAQILNYL